MADTGWNDYGILPAMSTTALINMLGSKEELLNAFDFHTNWHNSESYIVPKSATDASNGISIYNYNDCNTYIRLNGSNTYSYEIYKFNTADPTYTPNLRTRVVDNTTIIHCYPHTNSNFYFIVFLNNTLEHNIIMHTSVAYYNGGGPTDGRTPDRMSYCTCSLDNDNLAYAKSYSYMSYQDCFDKQCVQDSFKMFNSANDTNIYLLPIMYNGQQTGLYRKNKDSVTIQPFTEFVLDTTKYLYIVDGFTVKLY